MRRRSSSRTRATSLLSRIVLATISLALLIVALVGCGTAEEKRDVADSSGLFHFKVPAEWQFQVTSGTTSVYAAEALPEGGAEADALAIVAMVSDTTTETPVPEALVEYVAYWGETRGWTNVEAGEPVDATVGGRAASRVDITATDGNGRAFRAAYIWVRTNNREVLITAVTPPENWDTYAADLDAVLTDWFWHRPEGTSAEETTTP